MTACAAKKPIHAYQGGVKPDSALITLKVPEDISIITLDNQHFRRGARLFGSGAREIKLLPGSHALSADYRKIWDISKKDHESIKSDPIWLTFDAKAGEVIELKHPKVENLEASKALAFNLKVSAVNVTTGVTTHSQAAAFVSPLPYSLVLANASHQPQPIMPRQSVITPSTKVVAPSYETTSKSSSIDNEVDNLSQLKAFWVGASIEERQAFQSWVFSK